jgi:uncharacterized membrane protein
LEHPVIRRLAFSAIFIALSVALGFSLVHVPNVELVTMMVFLSGLLLGSRSGVTIGFCTMALFTIFNPMGVPVPLVAASQIASMAFIGLAGGLTANWICNSRRWARMALVGFICTVFYDLMTNAAMAIAFGLLPRMISVLIAGISFSLLHLASNTIIFAAIGPFVSRLRCRLQLK